MSLLSDCLRWTELAIERLGAGDRGTRNEMVLQSALGQSLMFTEGVSTRSQAAIGRARELAQSAHDFEQQFLAIIVHCRIRGRLQDFRGMLVLAREAKAIADAIADPVAGSTADCWIGVSLFWLADYPQALRFAGRACADATPMLRHTQIGRYGIDHAMVARCVTARIVWLQGLLDQAAQINRDILDDPELSGHPVSLCFALAWCGCPLSLVLGELEIAEQMIGRLREQSEVHALSMYYSCSLGLEGELAARRGDLAAAERLLRIGAARLERAQEEQLHSTLLGSLIEVLAQTGAVEQGLQVADDWVRRCERNELAMWMPEALRLKGVMLSLSGDAGAVAAEEHFRRSLELAHRQGALSWELRAAMSLGRLLDVQGRTGDAAGVLGPVCARFREGVQSSDVKSAQRLLETWR
jgi:ATP/maltotriose-dependent transcriptional regulator MalT